MVTQYAYRCSLVQPGYIISQDVVDVDGSSLYPTINGIKEVKCLIRDIDAGCSMELRVLLPKEIDVNNGIWERHYRLTCAALMISRRIWAECFRPSFAGMLRLFTLASWKQATSAYCKLETLSPVACDAFGPNEEFNLLNIFMRMEEVKVCR